MTDSDRAACAHPAPVLMPEPQHTLLGKSTVYSDTYDPSLLTPIPRSLGRNAIGRSDFRGCDVWRLYELTWLSPSGAPRTAAARLVVPASSPSIIESKSLKLYAFSFTQTPFASAAEVETVMTRDLSAAAGAPVQVTVGRPADTVGTAGELPGELIDGEAEGLLIRDYEVNPSLLAFDPKEDFAEETLSTRLFRSLCPVTGQPDFASFVIRYRGQRFSRSALLAYLVSYRCHRGFHEQCTEQAFADITSRLHPEFLEIQALFTRRGGIDINPFRSSEKDAPSRILREWRQ